MDYLMRKESTSVDVVYLSTLLKCLLDTVEDPLGVDMGKVNIIKDAYCNWGCNVAGKYDKALLQAQTSKRIVDLQNAFEKLSASAEISNIDNLYIDDEYDYDV